ncbi:MAG: hypothetical protein ACXWPM_08480 [Bdellovibrionota bacterium]
MFAAEALSKPHVFANLKRAGTLPYTLADLASDSRGEVTSALIEGLAQMEPADRPEVVAILFERLKKTDLPPVRVPEVLKAIRSAEHGTLREETVLNWLELAKERPDFRSAPYVEALGNELRGPYSKAVKKSLLDLFQKNGTLHPELHSVPGVVEAIKNARASEPDLIDWMWNLIEEHPDKTQKDAYYVEFFGSHVDPESAGPLRLVEHMQAHNCDEIVKLLLRIKPTNEEVLSRIRGLASDPDVAVRMESVKLAALFEPHSVARSEMLLLSLGAQPGKGQKAEGFAKLRLRAAEALKNDPPEEIAQELVRALNKEKRLEVQKAILEALASTKTEQEETRYLIQSALLDAFERIPDFRLDVLHLLDKQDLDPVLENRIIKMGLNPVRGKSGELLKAGKIPQDQLAYGPVELARKFAHTKETQEYLLGRLFEGNDSQHAIAASTLKKTELHPEVEGELIRRLTPKTDWLIRDSVYEILYNQAKYSESAGIALIEAALWETEPLNINKLLKNITEIYHAARGESEAVASRLIEAMKASPKFRSTARGIFEALPAEFTVEHADDLIEVVLKHARPGTRYAWHPVLEKIYGETGRLPSAALEALLDPHLPEEARLLLTGVYKDRLPADLDQLMAKLAEAKKAEEEARRTRRLVSRLTTSVCKFIPWRKR